MTMRKNSSGNLRFEFADKSVMRPLNLVFFLVFPLSALINFANADNYCDESGVSGRSSTTAPGIGGTGKNRPAKTIGIGGTGRSAKNIDIGGTGKPAKDIGIGGTGNSAKNIESDDGTGIGGTGVRGTITRFGSICVNGIRIRYSKNTPILLNGRRARASQLTLGQVVIVGALGKGHELKANHIQIQNELAGPIEYINQEQGTIQILGQKIKLSQILRKHFSNLKRNNYLAVSGLRNNKGTVIATHIKWLPAIDKVSLAGPVTKIELGAVHIYGKRIKVSSLQRLKLQVGTRISIEGRLKGNELVSSRIRKLANIPFSGRYKQISLQGYLNKRTSGAYIALDGLKIKLDRNSVVENGYSNMLGANTRVRVLVSVREDKSLVAKRIRIEYHHPDREQYKEITRGIIPKKKISLKPKEKNNRLLAKDEKNRSPSISKVEKEKIEKQEVEKEEIEKEKIEKEEVEKEEIEKEEMEKEEVEKEEIEKEEIEKEEVEKEETEKEESKKEKDKKS